MSAITSMFDGSSTGFPNVRIKQLVGRETIGVAPRKYRASLERSTEIGETIQALSIANDLLVAHTGMLAQWAAQDVAVLPGHTANEQALTQVRSRLALLDLVQRFSSADYARALGAEIQITPDTSETAKALFRLLPFESKTPKIAPDGDGGLMAVWEDLAAPVVMVIDNWKIHLITGAQTPHSEYFEDLPFDGERLPKEVIEAIPAY